MPAPVDLSSWPRRDVEGRELEHVLESDGVHHVHVDDGSPCDHALDQHSIESPEGEVTDAGKRD